MHGFTQRPWRAAAAPAPSHLATPSHPRTPTWSTVASLACAAARSAFRRASRLRTASCTPPTLPPSRARSALSASGVTASAVPPAGVPMGVDGTRLLVAWAEAGVAAGDAVPPTAAAAKLRARWCSCCACAGSTPSVGVGGGAAAKLRGVVSRAGVAVAAGRAPGVAASPAGRLPVKRMGVATGRT